MEVGAGQICMAEMIIKSSFQPKPFYQEIGYEAKMRGIHKQLSHFELNMKKSQLHDVTKFVLLKQLAG